MDAGSAFEFMTTTGSTIIGLAPWLQTPAGRYLLSWEQAQLDRGVSDIFGFHALQLGLPQLDALRANRMPNRWTVLDSHGELLASENAPTSTFAAKPTLVQPSTAQLRCEFDALPFDAQSIDLVVLPHTLEFARDPHLALREVDRVLRPEGRVAILGFNPTSLWRLRQHAGHLRRRMALNPTRPLYLPNKNEFIGYRRLRDWLRLLSFEVEAGRFGCYRPPFDSEQWLSRFEWMEAAGDRWWPVFGAAYFLVAVKRVRGMRLVGLIRKPHAAPKAAPAAVVHNNKARA